jgi:hypothetical protein
MSNLIAAEAALRVAWMKLQPYEHALEEAWTIFELAKFYVDSLPYVPHDNWHSTLVWNAAQRAEESYVRAQKLHDVARDSYDNVAKTYQIAWETHTC